MVQLQHGPLYHTPDAPLPGDWSRACIRAYKAAMRRLVLITAMVALVSCSKDKSPTTPPPAATPATTEPAPTPEDEAAAAKKAEDDKAAAELQKKLDEALARAQAEADTVKARWTPEAIAAFEKMRDKKHKTGKARLKAVLASKHRAPGNAERDKHRHPAETLAFFGLEPGMQVFEVGQGAGWYTEILAPYLAQGGQLWLAGYDAASTDPQTKHGAQRMELFLTAPGPLYAGVETLPQGPRGEPLNLGPADSLDMVLVVRMFHNVERFALWDAYMPSIHAALKEGAVLGVVQHRAAADADLAASAEKGYLPEAWLIAKIEGYGFKLDKKSEINANKKDTRDYDKGVWALPPSLANGDTDRAKYVAIGESDRSTLKFVKVAK